MSPEPQSSALYPSLESPPQQGLISSQLLLKMSVVGNDVSFEQADCPRRSGQEAVSIPSAGLDAGYAVNLLLVPVLGRVST